MTDLFPGLRRAAEICRDLAGECDAKIEAAPSPYVQANARRKVEARALRRAAGKITDAMLAEPIATAPSASGSPPRRGVVAHSRAVAALAPFADIDMAAAELERLGFGPKPIGMEL